MSLQITLHETFSVLLIFSRFKFFWLVRYANCAREVCMCTLRDRKNVTVCSQVLSVIKTAGVSLRSHLRP